MRRGGALDATAGVDTIVVVVVVGDTDVNPLVILDDEAFDMGQLPRQIRDSLPVLTPALLLEVRVVIHLKTISCETAYV